MAVRGKHTPPHARRLAARAAIREGRLLRDIVVAAPLSSLSDAIAQQLTAGAFLLPAAAALILFVALRMGKMEAVESGVVMSKCLQSPILVHST